MTAKEGSLPDSFCPLRWGMLQVELESCKIKACCKTPFLNLSHHDLDILGKQAIFNHPFIVERRREMLDGRFHQDCASCWDLEKAGVPSYRETEAAKVAFAGLTGRDRTLAAPSRAIPRHVEIIVGTTCDLSCTYCGPEFSSAWRSKLKMLTAAQRSRETATPRAKFARLFEAWLIESLPAIRHIQFNGGEPLLNAEFYHILDLILERSADGHTPDFGIISNMNAPPRLLDRFMERVARIEAPKRFVLGVSVDATGKKAEYIRTGLNWPRFEANIRRILSSDLPIDLAFAPTMSILNIQAIDDLVRWVHELQDGYGKTLSWRPSIVTDPACLSPLIATNELAAVLPETASWLDTHTDWSNLSHYLRSVHAGIGQVTDIARRRQAFRDWAGRHSAGTANLREYLPELTDFAIGAREEAA